MKKPESQSRSKSPEERKIGTKSPENEGTNSGLRVASLENVETQPKSFSTENETVKDFNKDEKRENVKIKKESENSVSPKISESEKMEKGVDNKESSLREGREDVEKEMKKNTRDIDERNRINEEEKYKEDKKIYCPEIVCVVLSMILIVITFPLSLLFTVKIVNQFERAVIFRLGRVRKGRARGPGLFFIIPCTDEFVKIDLRTFVAKIKPQEVLTKDSCTVYVDAIVFFRVNDPLEACTKIRNYSEATWLLAAITVRNSLGKRALNEILQFRTQIADEIETELDLRTETWGVKVEVVELSDISLPQAMQRAMAAEAEATRDAKAKVIGAEGELNASSALKDASDILSEKREALQLRYLQTLGAIATEQFSTVVFPIPVEVGNE